MTPAVHAPEKARRRGKPAKPKAPATLAEAAQRALAETDSYEDAADRLLDILTPRLREELLADWERRAALDLVRKTAAVERRAAWTPPAAPSAAQQAADVRALARGVTASLMDSRLPGGGRIADATRADLEKAARFFHSQADDMRWKADWLDRVREATPAGKRVADALDETRLRALQDAASRPAATTGALS